MLRLGLRGYSAQEDTCLTTVDLNIALMLGYNPQKQSKAVIKMADQEED